MLHLLGTLITGAIVGWIAGNIMGDHGSLLRNIIVGVVGSGIGGFLCALIGIWSYGFLFGLIVDVVGACILLWIIHALFGRR